MIREYIEQLEGKGEVYIKVKVRPGAKKTEIKAIMKGDEDVVKIDIREQAERGRANSELSNFLAKEFQVDKDNIRIISGAQTRIKLIKILK